MIDTIQWAGLWRISNIEHISIGSNRIHYGITSNLVQL